MCFHSCQIKTQRTKQNIRCTSPRKQPPPHEGASFPLITGCLDQCGESDPSRLVSASPQTGWAQLSARLDEIRKWLRTGLRKGLRSWFVVHLNLFRETDLSGQVSERSGPPETNCMSDFSSVKLPRPRFDVWGSCSGSHGPRKPVQCKNCISDFV